MIVTYQKRRRRRLGENIASDFQNAQALSAMQAYTPQPIPAGAPFPTGGLVASGDNPLNWPGDTQLSLDPNAAAINAAQAITNPSGSWASSTGSGYGIIPVTGSWASSTGSGYGIIPVTISPTTWPWYIWAAIAAGVILVAKR